METKNLNVEINSGSLESCANRIDTINGRIEEIFNNIDTIMSNVNNNDNWKGDTSKEYHERYLLLKEYFPKINNGLENYSKFLRTTANNYETAENKINSNIDVNTDNLTVNG